MDTPKLESLYRRWLTEVWGEGRTDAARELMAEDLIDHNPYPGQPPGLEGHDWAVAMIRRAFPDLRFTPDVVVGRRSSAPATASLPRSGTRKTPPACSASSAWNLRRPSCA